MDERPLVSILSNVKNRAYTIRRCVESIMNQDYPNIEHIIQDGASTDGTREILQDYAARYPERIRLVSEPDRSGEEAFFRALKRMNGAIMGTCLSDEELLPHAVSWAVDRFMEYPQAGAVYGDCYTSDLDGNILKETRTRGFSIGEYLCHEVVPPFAASFFRVDCLKEIGLLDSEWSFSVGEFELWVRLGLRFPIQYIPGFVAKFGMHPDSNTSKPGVVLGLIEPRLEMMAKLFTSPDTPESLRQLAPRAYAGLHLWVAESLIGMGAYREAGLQLEAAMQYKPNIFRIADMMLMLARYTSEWGDVPQKALQMAVNLDDKRSDVRYLYAVALYMAGDDEDAEILAKATLELQPDLPGANDVLGRIQARKVNKTRLTFAATAGESPAAQGNSAAAAGADTVALIQEGNLALGRGDLPHAAHCFHQALQRNPADRQAWEGFAEAARRAGNETAYEWALSQAHTLQAP
jgi:tetratricopeptide (TPR) repeat protein